jgi:hypothetical protein
MVVVGTFGMLDVVGVVDVGEEVGMLGKRTTLEAQRSQSEGEVCMPWLTFLWMEGYYFDRWDLWRIIQKGLTMPFE